MRLIASKAAVKIQISKLGKARAKNCDAAYVLYNMSNFLQAMQYDDES